MKPKTVTNRRAPSEIIAKILTRVDKPCKMIKILRFAEINNSQWKRYRKALLNTKILEQNGRFYKITTKGRELLIAYALLYPVLYRLKNREGLP